MVLHGGVVGPWCGAIRAAAGRIFNVGVVDDGLLIASLGRRHLAVNNGQKVGMFHGGACC